MDRLNEWRIGGVISGTFAVRASTPTASTLYTQYGTAIFVGLESDER